MTTENSVLAPFTGLDLLLGNPVATKDLSRSDHNGDRKSGSEVGEPKKTVAGRFSVVVPAYNAAGTLAPCLESLVALDWPDFEIIIADDGSTDATAEVAARYPCRVVRLPRNLGPGMARNAGAAAASGEFLAFTDSDCIIPSQWLRNFNEAFRDLAVCAVTGGYSDAYGRDFLKRYQLLSLAHRQRHLPPRIESAITSNLACRRRAFDAVGGFPEYYLRGIDKPIWGNEDEEFGFLLSRVGEVAWDKDNGVTHHFRSTFGAYARQQTWYAERIMLSHCLFPRLRATVTNYSRSSVVLGFACAFLLPLLGLAAWGLWEALGCDMRHDVETTFGTCCRTLGALWPELLVLGVAGWLMTQFPKLRFYRSQGLPWTLVLGAMAMDLMGHFCLLFGSLRGVILSRKGVSRCSG